MRISDWSSDVCSSDLREDFEVAHTADGEDAMLLARENPPDLVLLDWMIEGVSGIEVCRRLRRHPETANVPIIMLTARGEEADRLRGLETGPHAYIPPPFSPRPLAARLGLVLPPARPASAAAPPAHPRPQPLRRPPPAHPG